MSRLKRLLFSWHERPNAFCVSCAMNRWHIRRLYLKEPAVKSNQKGGE